MVIIFFLLSRKNKSHVINPTFEEREVKNNNYWEVDENGRQFRLVSKQQELARKTFIKASFIGKYWGEINEKFSSRFQHWEFYDFHIYDAHLKKAIWNKNSFDLPEDLTIPRERLPKILQTTLEINESTYDIFLHEPTFCDIRMDRKLHQREGNEVFGTFAATVTGYILDTVTEEYLEIIYKEDGNTAQDPILEKKDELYKTSVPTGNIERKRNYARIEYYQSDLINTYWSDWERESPTSSSNNESFLSSCSSIFGLLFIATILLVLLPHLGFLIPIVIIGFLLFAIPPKIWTGLFQIFTTLIFVVFAIILLFKIFDPAPNLAIQETKKEDNTIPSETDMAFQDDEDVEDGQKSFIKHFWKWRDYDDILYEGEFSVNKADYKKSSTYKTQLPIEIYTPSDYDRLIYSLKEFDKTKLDGIYRMFDSIQRGNNINRFKFPQVIVSFVQSIPYALILDNECNPMLQSDNFVKEYLSSPDAICQGNQRFGINTPVEFLTHLHGDCDTRTLLLYSILSHYNYDVVLLSSEYYSHSILGIKLPVNGMTYNYGADRFVVWETTAPNIKPGILPKQMSNMNHWRISLKSK